MNVTESRFKNRQLHVEDYLQMVSAEQKEYAEVFDYSKITEKSGVITDYWTNNLLDLILRKENLNEAYKQVKRNAVMIFKFELFPTNRLALHSLLIIRGVPFAALRIASSALSSNTVCVHPAPFSLAVT